MRKLIFLALLPILVLTGCHSATHQTVRTCKHDFELRRVEHLFSVTRYEYVCKYCEKTNIFYSEVSADEPN